jgi:hypothetical protein
MNDSYNNEPNFSLNDFKKWMANQIDKPTKKSLRHHEIIGTQVESKIGVKRLMSKMLVDESDDARELAEDFHQHGGVVLDTDRDENLLIETDSGSFTLPRYFVRKAK